MKTKHEAETAHDEPTLHSGNGKAPQFDPIDAIAARFSAADDNAMTVREAFAYADSSFSFGNGQFVNVPWYLEGGLSLDCRRAVALIREANKANASDDDEMGRSVNQAEANAQAALADALPIPTLLEEALDNWFYQYAKMPKAEKDAAKYTLDLTFWNGQIDPRLVSIHNPEGRVYVLATNFDQRRTFVNRVLARDLLTVVPNGLPDAGKLWLDVTRQAIIDYISAIRLNDDGSVKRKNKPAKTGTVVSSTNGKASAEALI